MEKPIIESIWKQFGASIDMLENAIQLCPAEMWNTKDQFWYNAYHCLFYLDYYLTTEPDTFQPPPPFTLSEFDPSGKMPDRVYNKDELLAYLNRCREKCLGLLSSAGNDIAAKRWKNQFKDYSLFEILIYNMRHVQHHAAQLNLLLRQRINNAPKWVSQTKTDI